MPRKRQGENARAAYIEEKFAEEARRRNYNADSLLKKAKTNATRKRVENYLCRQFATLRPHEKRHYQYIAEKKWPLWFERCNAGVGLKHFFPGPEGVVQWELDRFTQDKRQYDPGRNRFLARERAVDQATKARFSGIKRKIRRARGLCYPKAPGPLLAPDNRSGGTGRLDLDGATEKAKREMSRFGAAPGTWKFHRHIYRRSHRNGKFLRVQVLVYRLTDNSDRTVGTIVLKKEQQPSNRVSSPGKHQLSREEGEIHGELYAACPRYVVALFNGSLRQEDNTFPSDDPDKTKQVVKRIVTEWIPHGHLVQFIHHYVESGHLIPEPFIWYCFKVMTEVALVCWNGQADREVKPGWEHVVNTDIKPDNIWLGDPDPHEPMAWARHYPQPKVGDFGMSYKTHHGLDDRNYVGDRTRKRVNPPDFRGYGTFGHMPPELNHRDAQKLTNDFGIHPDRAQQTVDRLNADLPHTPLPWPDPWPADLPPDNSGVHSWTMVWEIGMVVWCMLATIPVGGRDAVGGPNYPLEIVVDFSGGSPRHDVPPRRESGGYPLRPAYSGRLVELAFRCLEVMPTDRIDLVDLWEEVCGGCEDVGAQFDGNGVPNEVTYLPDKYPFGRNVLNDVSPY